MKGDLISRNDTEQRMVKALVELIRNRQAIFKEGSTNVILSVIQNAPAATSAPEWVSVKDRLPGETGSYIICTENHAVCTARYYAKSGLFNGVAGRHATYWMPLPEPPKEV